MFGCIVPNLKSKVAVAAVGSDRVDAGAVAAHVRVERALVPVHTGRLGRGQHEAIVTKALEAAGDIPALSVATHARVLGALVHVETVAAGDISAVATRAPALKGAGRVDATRVPSADTLPRVHLTLVAVDAVVRGHVLHVARVAAAGERAGRVDADPVLADARHEEALVDLRGQVGQGVPHHALRDVFATQRGMSCRPLHWAGSAVRTPRLAEGAATDKPLY